MHTLVEELLALVPPPGSPWPRDARQRWVAALGAVLDVVYEDVPAAGARGTGLPAQQEPAYAPQHLSQPAYEPPPYQPAYEPPPYQPLESYDQPPQPDLPDPAERVAPPWSSPDMWSVLDLRPDPLDADDGSGRHTRGGPPYE